MAGTVRRAGGLLAVGMLIVGLGACGDDDDDETGDGGDALAGDATEADAAAFCDAAVAVDTASLGLESGDTSPDEVDQRLQAAEDSAPDEISGAVATLVDEARTMLSEAGDEVAAEEEGPPPIPGDEFFAASAEVGAYLSDNCDFETVEVTATNYEFAGIPESVPAGTTLFTLANEADEFHEIALFAIAEGEERSVEELLALPDEEVEGLVTEKAFSLAPPGAESFVTAELEAGRYVVLCFVPVGATPEALESGEPLDEADSHFMHGMLAEFEAA